MHSTVRDSAKSAKRSSRVRRAGRRIVGLATAALLLPLSLPAQEAPAVDWSAIDVSIQRALDLWPTPGLAVAVVKDDSVVFARGYGVRRMDSSAPVDEHTLFAVASNTKAFTAALLESLAEEGKLTLDDRVIDHLPGFKLWDGWVTREIRVRDLLTHRSGLPTFGGDHLWIGQNLPPQEILHRVRWLEPAGLFRASFHYQNLMYMAAGEVAAAAAGEPWQRLVTERILEPLGMRETNTSVRDLAGISNVASPHEVVAGTLQPVEYDDVDGVAPAAALNSNVLDMARWMRANLNLGELDGVRILRQRSAREMQSVQYPLPVSRFAEDSLDQHFSGYGLGWFLGEYRGRKMVTHSGGLTGMISLQTLLPEERLGVVVLTNFAPDAPTREITRTILDAFLAAPPKDWIGEGAEQMRTRKEAAARAEERLQASRLEGTSPSLPLEAYAGVYADSLSGRATVRVEDGHLVFDYNPRHLGDLVHWNFDTFRVHWRHPIFDMQPRTFLQFELGENGRVEGLTVTFYHPQHLRRLHESEVE